MRATLRVRSRLANGSRSTPLAVACTANSEMPASVLAAKRMTSAVWPSNTMPASPWTRNSSPCRAVRVTLSGSQASSSPLRISVAVVEPSTIDGTKAPIASRSTAGQQRLRGHGHRGEERRAEERTAHLLEDDGQCGHVRASAAPLLGNGDTVQAQLARHLAPHGLVVARFGHHQLAHGGAGGGHGQKAAYCVAKVAELT